ncbi:hypothetical protein QQ045_024938 [Rhodiola kirilowii]
MEVCIFYNDHEHVNSPFASFLLRSISFNDRDLKSHKTEIDSRTRINEGSLSFQRLELESQISFNSSPMDNEDGRLVVEPLSSQCKKMVEDFPRSNSFESKSNEEELQRPRFLPGEIHEPQRFYLCDFERNLAATKLQKVYKSFRTRRQLADCAVLVEQKWWKVLDFAELKRSSISFFDIEKPESAVSRWSRARTKAAKVGKGLSKDAKARKLALQHWLEAIDPRHRYGHNLQFYYANWLHCESKQPFFYWLDIGEGKEVNLERCSRGKLQQQCIKYLGPAEREAYEIKIEEGKFVYKSNGQFLDTTGGPADVKWIFVLSTTKTLYVGQKSKGTFQHSSFLAGGATLSAGRLLVEKGHLKAVWPHSGHYLPTEENFQEFLCFLEEHNVDLTEVKKSPDEVGDQEFSMIDFRGTESEFLLSDHNHEHGNRPVIPRPRVSKLSRKLRSKITTLEIPTRPDVMEILGHEEESEAGNGFITCRPQYSPESSSTDDGYETAEEYFLTEEDFMVPKANLFDESHEEEGENHILKEQILRRINSHKGMRSYQLGNQLSSKWTTGAGPRIGCMRDYPSEIRFRIMEQAHLSPRNRTVTSSLRDPSRFASVASTPTDF